MKSESRLSIIDFRRGLMLVASGLLFAWSTAAWSHAHPEQRTPAPGATLQQAPANVRILFSAALEPAFSRLKVTNRQGHSVDQGDSRVDSDNPRLMMVALEQLAPGTYTVHWHVVARDGHTTHGQYTFQVRPAQDQPGQDQ